MTPFEPSGVGAGVSSPWSCGRAPGRRAPCLRFGRVHRAPFSCGEFLVCDAAASGSGNQVVQALEGMALDVPLVQPEGELVDVPAKVLLARLVVDAMNPALQDGPHGLNAVSVDAIADVFARAVVDGIALEEQPTEAVIGRVLVAVDRAACFDVLVDRGVQRGDIHVPDRQGDSAPAALTHAEDGGFSHGAAPELLALARVLVGFQAADVRLVHFDDAGEDFQVRAARLAQPPENEPRGLLRDADLLRQLQAADALARRDEQVHGIEPFMERNVAALEDRPGPDGEVLLAGVTAVEAATARRDALAARTDRALDAIGPTARFQVHARGLLVREHLEKLQGADGYFVFNDLLLIRCGDWAAAGMAGFAIVGVLLEGHGDRMATRQGALELLLLPVGFLCGAACVAAHAHCGFPRALFLALILALDEVHQAGKGAARFREDGLGALCHGSFSYGFVRATVYVIPLIPVGVKYINPFRFVRLGTRGARATC